MSIRWRSLAVVALVVLPAGAGMTRVTAQTRTAPAAVRRGAQVLAQGRAAGSPRLGAVPAQSGESPPPEATAAEPLPPTATPPAPDTATATDTPESRHTGPLPTATPAPPDGRANTIAQEIAWLRVAPDHPRTLYVELAAQPYGWKVLRSTDAGVTWTNLDPILNHDLAGGNTGKLSPLLIAAGGKRLYMDYCACASMSPNVTGIVSSADGGVTWHPLPLGLDEQIWLGSLVVSPAAPPRLYALAGLTVFRGQSRQVTITSADGGATWTKQSQPVLNEGCFVAGCPATLNGCVQYGRGCATMEIVADPTVATTLYVNVSASGGAPDVQPLVVRSEDAGQTWTQLQGVGSVAVDPTRRGIQRTDVWPAVVSTDHGRTWQPATCPGASEGTCPRFTVDNLFGAGASYAFLGDGIYRFHGAGPAEARLAVSDRLPVAPGDIRTAQGGARAGDPIYLLTAATDGMVTGTVYRSTDEGQSWQQLAVGFAWPTRWPASHAPGTVYDPQSGHSIAAPLVRLAGRLGLVVAGRPVTEAYVAGATLRQDFSHLSLQYVGGTATV